MLGSTVIRTTAIVLIAATSARAADRPALLILPFDMVDTSGEIPSHADDGVAPILCERLRKVLRQCHQSIFVLLCDPMPISAEIEKARTVRLTECNGYELDLARLVHADGC